MLDEVTGLDETWLVTISGYLGLKVGIRVWLEKGVEGVMVTDGDRKTLEELCGELDVLRAPSDYVFIPPKKCWFPLPPELKHDPFEGEYEIIERSSNPVRSAELLTHVFEVMKRYKLFFATYDELGKSFYELNQKPRQEISSAVKYAHNKGQTAIFGRLFLGIIPQRDDFFVHWDVEKRCL